MLTRRIAPKIAAALGAYRAVVPDISRADAIRGRARGFVVQVAVAPAAP